MRNLYKYFKNEFQFGINIWNSVSILASICISLPVIFIISNFYIESENWLHIKSNLLSGYIYTTLYLVFGVGIISALIGVGCAWFVTCYNFYGRKYIEWILILPMTVPTYIAAYSYYDILETFNPFFNWSRNYFGLEKTMMIENSLIYLIVIVLFSFVLYPYIYLSTKASLLLQGNKIVEAANTLGIPTNKILRKVVIPIIRPAIIAGVSLVIMETLNDYAAVEYFGLSTLTIGVFRSWFGMDDMESALKLSSLLVTFVFVMIAVEKFYRKDAKYDNNRLSAPLKKTNIKKKNQLLILLFCLTPFFFGFLIPIIRLLSWMLRSDINLYDNNLLIITFNTVWISLISAIIIVIITYLINFSKNYFNNDALKKVSGLAVLGYSMPGAIIAIGVLKLNSTISELTSFILIGSITGLIFSYLVRFLAVAWQPIDSSMEKLSTNVNLASRTLNVRPIKSLLNLNLPILKKPLLIACLIVFIDISKELPLTLILRPFNFDTLATKTYDLVNQAQFFQSSIPSLIIIFISMPAILMINHQIEKEGK